MLTTLYRKIIGGVVLLLIAILQYQLWFGESGLFDLIHLKKDISAAQAQNQEFEERNRILRAEVNDLKSGYESIEEHARLDLGLIKPGETFVQYSILPPPVELQTDSQPAAVSNDAVLNELEAVSTP